MFNIHVSFCTLSTIAAPSCHLRTRLNRHAGSTSQSLIPTCSSSRSTYTLNSSQMLRCPNFRIDEEQGGKKAKRPNRQASSRSEPPTTTECKSFQTRVHFYLSQTSLLVLSTQVILLAFMDTIRRGSLLFVTLPPIALCLQGALWTANHASFYRYGGIVASTASSIVQVGTNLC